MNRVIIVIASLCLVFVIPRVNSDGLSVAPEPIVEESEEMAIQKLEYLETKCKDGIESVIRQVFPAIIRGSSSLDLNPQCMGSFLKLITDLKDMKLWAFQMIDSTGIPIGGMIRGKGSDMGSYLQCLDIVIPRGHSKVEQTGQFCVARIRPPLPPRPRKLGMFESVFSKVNSTLKTEAINELIRSLFVFYDTPLKMGLCVPSTCSKEEINAVVQTLSEHIGLNTDIEFCVTKKPSSLDTVQISILGLYLAIVVVNIVATVWDEVAKFGGKTKEGLIPKMVQSFSIRRNIINLVTIKASEGRSLDCMHGMRVISLTWVVLGHAYFQVERNLLRETVVLGEYTRGFAFQTIINAFHSVDTFFFISSVLVAYNLVKHVDSGNSFPFFYSIILRALRLLPSLLLVISIVIVLPAFGSGPLFQEIMGDQANLCRDKWWSNALFFSNVGNIYKMCLPHGWYVSVEFQCFLISLVYFRLLFKNKKWGNAFIIVLILTCVLASGIVTYVLDLTPTVLARYITDLRFSFMYAKYVYIRAYVYLGGYAVGLFLGTYLARNPEVNLSAVTTMLGWPIAFATATALVYATYPWNKGDDFSTIETVLYAALHRTTWGLCMAWVVLSCYAGKGGVIHSFLSWPAFQPFVRLSYLVYLIHIPLYFYVLSSKLGPSDATHIAFVFHFFGALCSSHIIAFFIKIIFEYPITHLTVLFFRNLHERSKKPIEIREQTKC